MISPGGGDSLWFDVFAAVARCNLSLRDNAVAADFGGSASENAAHLSIIHRQFYEAYKGNSPVFDLIKIHSMYSSFNFQLLSLQQYHHDSV